MKPIQTLSQEVNKRIHTCKDCGGAGQVENKNNRIDSNGLSIAVDCTTCKGDGYVIPLEEGCEVLYKWDDGGIDETTITWVRQKCTPQDHIKITLKNHGDAYSDDVELTILGKPLTLQDILRCLRSGTEMETDRTRIIIHGEEIVELPFTDPKEWNDETIEALIKLIK